MYLSTKTKFLDRGFQRLDAPEQTDRQTNAQTHYHVMRRINER